MPGDAILDKFKVLCSIRLPHSTPNNSNYTLFQDALRGRENPLPDANPILDRNTLEDNVQEEMMLQFQV